MPLDSSSLASLARVEEKVASAAAQPAPLSSSPTASSLPSTPSVDLALRRLEAAFLLRSEEKHSVAATRLLQPLLAQLQQHQPHCSKCSGRSDGVERVAEQRPAVSGSGCRPPLLCVPCGWLSSAASLSPPLFCRALLLQRVSHVTLVKALEGRVKVFQRANNTGAAFRDEVARAIDLLLSHDQLDRQQMLDMQQQRTLQRSRHHPAPAAGVASSTVAAPFLAQPPSESLKAPREAARAEHKEAEHSALYDTDDDDDRADEASEELEKALVGRVEEKEPADVTERAAAASGEETRGVNDARGVPGHRAKVVGAAERSPPAAAVVCASPSSVLSGASCPAELRVLMALSLLCCKFATENAPFNLRKSEIVKRKSPPHSHPSSTQWCTLSRLTSSHVLALSDAARVRGLRVLLQLLQCAPSVFRCSRGGVMLLRRFVCPSLLTACITDVPAVFRLVLSVFLHLYDEYRAHLLIELGTLIELMFIPLLESPHCTVAQKRDIVDVLAHCLATSQQVVELYYNFDNQRPTWKVFERIVVALSRLCEGDVPFAPTHSTATSSSPSHVPHSSRSSHSSHARHHSPQPLSSVAEEASLTDPPPSPSPSSTASASAASPSAASSALADEGQLDGLTRASLRLLVHVLHMQAQWLGVQGVHRPQASSASPFPSPAAALQTAGDAEEEQRLSIQQRSHSNSISSSSSPFSSTNASRSTLMRDAGGPSSPSSVDVRVSASPPPPLVSAAAASFFASSPISDVAAAAALPASSPSSAPPLPPLPLTPSPSPPPLSSPSASSDLSAALLIHSKLMSNLVRHSTWMNRVDQQRADAAIVSHALKLARTEKLSSAVRYLKLVHPPSAWPLEVALFLYRHGEGQLDKAEVGDLLSTSSDSLLSQAEYDALRAAYLSLLDWTGMSFESGLRAFLTSSGFRLPGEAQRIDRMLVSFCLSYCQDNADSFPSPDAAFILAFALVMLNTDQHNSNIRHRQSMTEEQFINNLRGVNNGLDFDRAMLQQCYHSIRSDEIRFIATRSHTHTTTTTRTQPQTQKKGHRKPQPSTSPAAHHRGISAAADSASASASASRSSSLTSSASSSPSSSRASSAAGGSELVGVDGCGAAEVARDVSEEKALRDAVSRSFLEVLTRKSLALLKNSAVQSRGLHHSTDCGIVAGMFEVTWLRCIAAITVICESSVDVDVLHACLDGLMYGSCIAVVLCLPMERQAYSRVLAKLTFMERVLGSFSFASLLLSSKEDADTAECQRQILRGEHLKEEWFRGVQLYAEKNPTRAVQLLQSTCRDTQRKVNSERRRALVHAVQLSFNNELQLTDNAQRALIKQGKLTKLSRDGKRQPYYVFLFSDLLIYAGAGLQAGTYKVHRCLHLSLCRLEDIHRGAAQIGGSDAGVADSSGGSTTFRLVSPQKSIVLCCGSADKKQQWMDSILTHIKQQLQHRMQHFQTCTQPQQKHASHPTSPFHSSHQLQQQQRIATVDEGGAGGAGVAPLALQLSSSAGGAAGVTVGVLKGSNSEVAGMGGRGGPSRAVRRPSPSAVSRTSSAALRVEASAPASSMGGEAPSPAPSSERVEGEGWSSVSEELRRYSTFIGSQWTSRQLRSSSSSSSAGAGSMPTFCKLCLRLFGVFRRRVTCEGCSDVVCHQCAQQRLPLAKHSKAKVGLAAEVPVRDGKETAGGAEGRGRVCDACYGVLQGSISRQSTLLIRVRA